MSTKTQEWSVSVTWEDVEKRNQSNGYHFFDDDTMSFFSTRANGEPILNEEDGNVYGVVSGKGPHGPRYHDVIQVEPDGAVSRAHDPENPHDSDKRPLRFENREEAIKAKDSLAFNREPYPPASYYRWY